MTLVRIFPEDYSHIVTADANREIWICTSEKIVHEAARNFCYWAVRVHLSSKTDSCYSYAMPSRETRTGKLAPLLRAMVEVGFIIFLFYSNLLMGEFTKTNADRKSLVFAIQDIFTINNFVIALISGLIGYVVVEFLRKRV
jgi:hypothetical protein